MNRSVRNGLAIAGMAGGIFFLGQAVASATTTQTNTNTDTISTPGGPGGSSGTLNGNLQVNAADTSTKVINAPEQTSTATNNVSVTVPAGAPVTVKVEDTKITQTATSTISGGNQTVDLPTAPAVTQSNTNTVTETTTAKPEGQPKAGGPPNGGPPKVGTNGTNTAALAPLAANGPQMMTQPQGPGNTNLNGQINLLDGSTTIINKPEQTSTASNNVSIDFSNATFYCGNLTVTVLTPQQCQYYIKIEGLNITQNATSTITGGNQVIGHEGQPGHEGQVGDKGRDNEHHAKPVMKVECPKKAAPAAPAAVKPAAVVKPAVHAKVLSSAQPTKALAFTGAETSAPLTLGLIALGAGGALTLAGRRRSATAAV